MSPHIVFDKTCKENAYLVFQFSSGCLTTDNYRNRIKSLVISKWILFQIQLQLCKCEEFQNFKDLSRS